MAPLPAARLRPFGFLLLLHPALMRTRDVSLGARMFLIARRLLGSRRNLRRRENGRAQFSWVPKGKGNGSFLLGSHFRSRRTPPPSGRRARPLPTSPPPLALRAEFVTRASDLARRHCACVGLCQRRAGSSCGRRALQMFVFKSPPLGQ